MWIEVHSEADLPRESGTKAVVYHGVTAWMYFNSDTKTWHPISGWRKNIGQSWKDVTAYMELPEYRPISFTLTEDLVLQDHWLDEITGD